MILIESTCALFSVVDSTRNTMDTVVTIIQYICVYTIDRCQLAELLKEIENNELKNLKSFAILTVYVLEKYCKDILYY